MNMQVYQSMYDILNELDTLSVLEREEFKDIQKHIRNELKEKWNIKCDDHDHVFRYHSLLNGLIESIREDKNIKKEERIQYILEKYYPEYYSKKCIFYSFFSCMSVKR